MKDYLIMKLFAILIIVLPVCMSGLINPLFVNQPTFVYNIWNDENESVNVPKNHQSTSLYPIDKNISFIEYETSIEFLDKKKNDYSLQVTTYSKTNEPSNTRQDLALLFIDGVFVDSLANRIDQTDIIEQQQVITESQSARFDVITFHHSQRQDHSGDMLFQYELSHDHAYVLSSPITSVNLFRQPRTNTQKQWQGMLDRTITKEWNRQWQSLIEYYSLNADDYERIAVLHLPDFVERQLSASSKRSLKSIIGLIWYDLYHQYILGKVNNSNQPINTKGSTMPVILLAKDFSHYHILFQTEGGLEQKITREL